MSDIPRLGIIILAPQGHLESPASKAAAFTTLSAFQVLYSPRPAPWAQRLLLNFYYAFALSPVRRRLLVMNEFSATRQMMQYFHQMLKAKQPSPYSSISEEDGVQCRIADRCPESRVKEG